MAIFRINVRKVRVYLFWLSAITSELALLSIIELFLFWLVLSMLASLVVLRSFKPFLHFSSNYPYLGLLMLRPRYLAQTKLSTYADFLGLAAYRRSASSSEWHNASFRFFMFSLCVKFWIIIFQESLPKLIVRWSGCFQLF